MLGNLFLISNMIINILCIINHIDNVITFLINSVPIVYKKIEVDLFDLSDSD